jgi:hypothetical protein
MKIKKYFSRKNIFIFYLFIILLIRLILATGVRVWAFSDNHYDDGMMLKDASNFISSGWLGSFDQYTLAKGITFPLYLSLIHKIGLPFLFGNVLLCFVASLTFIMAIKKIIPNNNALAIIYTILMFNPIASASWTFQRVYRDSIYSYLVVILFSLIISIYLNRDSTIRKLLLLNLSSGFFLSSVWLAREDSPWVAPFVFVALIITACSIFFSQQYKQKLKKLIILTITPIFLVVSILTVSTINYVHYGVFATNEYTGGYLPDLFKALTIIQPDKWMAQVPIPESTREKAYEVSPTFAKLKPVLEKHPFVVNTGGNASCSMLAWAIIDSVEWYGLKDGKSSQQFYKQSAQEINTAIREGKLKTRGGYIFMFESPWDNRYIKPLIKSFGETLSMTIQMGQYYNSRNIPFDSKSNLTMTMQTSQTKNVNIPLSARNITNYGNYSQVKQLENITNSLSYHQGEPIPKRETKLNVMNYISYIYYKFNPLFFFIGTLCYLYISLRFIFSIRKKKYFLGNEWVIMTGLLLSYLLRLLLISYTDVCSIFMKYSMYLAPSYWLVLMFTFASIFIATRDILKRYNFSNNKISSL